jgi:hypothetical protein
MPPINFDNVRHRRLRPDDNFSKFHCDLDDDLGCDDFIHNEAKQYQKERHGITYIFFYNRKKIGYVKSTEKSGPDEVIPFGLVMSP